VHHSSPQLLLLPVLHLLQLLPKYLDLLVLEGGLDAHSIQLLLRDLVPVRCISAVHAQLSAFP
jgi:hypothetical protein